MMNGKRVGRRFLLVAILPVGLSCVGLLACGGNGKSDSKPRSASESVAPPSQGTKLESSEEKSPENNETSAIPADWKTFQCEGWALSFPGNWSGDTEAGVWWPGKGNLDMGRPPLSVHCGSIPLMGNRSLEDRVSAYIKGDFLEKENLSVAGFSGFKCLWEFMGNKHLGIFLEEKMSGVVRLIHFVDCQSPSNDFDKHKGDFESIVASLRK